MSMLDELLAYHSKNPISKILENFMKIRSQESNKYALHAFYLELSCYVDRKNGSKKMMKLYKLFVAASFSIYEEQLDSCYFDKLMYAIFSNDDERDILKLSVSLLEKEVNRSLLLVASQSKGSSTSNEFTVPWFYKKAIYWESFLKSRLYRNIFYGITNFWEVFFENRGWSEQTYRIWESYQKYEKAEEEERSKDLKKWKEKDDIRDQNNRHKAKIEKILKKDMKESEVWDWLNFFSKVFLDQLKGPTPNPSKEHPIVFEEPYFQLKGQYSSKHIQRPIYWIESTQINFVIKSIDRSKDGPADWEDINVLGEFTQLHAKDARKSKFLQLSRGVKELFCAQPLRRFLHCICLFGDKFELWLFDRSGAYSTGPKNIVDDKEMLVRAISSYLLMSNEELGCDMTILQYGEDRFVQFPKIGYIPGPSFEIKPKPTVRPRRLITRGTTCYETKDELSVIKYSWTNPKENNEVDFLDVAKKVRGVVNCIASEVIYETKSHLDNLDLSNALFWNLKVDEKHMSLYNELERIQRYSLKKNRRLTRIAMTPRGRAIYSGGSILDFVAGIRDAIMGHEGLAGKGILHGDISEGNIILLKPTPDNDLHGMLIDLDISVKMEGNIGLGYDNSLRGTLKFIALEKLRYSKDMKPISRTCRHDLESFFYVFIVGCIEYESVPSDEANDLEKWCTKSISSNFRSKAEDIVNFDTEILAKFTPSFMGLKELAKKLRQILFNDDGQYILTPEDCGPMYRKIINAFDETIENIKGGRIENKIFEARQK